MAFITLICPECRYAKVYNGRGRCRCGVYLIHHMKGTVTVSGRGRVWDMKHKPPRLLHDDAARKAGL